jgi:hypothetical protein
MKLLDKIVDFIIEKLMSYRHKRKLKELRKKDPFIYP